VYATATLVLALLLALAGAACLTLAMTWHRPAAVRPTRLAPSRVLSPQFQAPPLVGALDVECELREAVRHVANDTIGQDVRFELAVQPGLRLKADPGTLRSVVLSLLRGAVRDGRCQSILISAMRQSGRVRIAVSDDAPEAATRKREAELRDASQMIALQGGSMQIEAHSDGGTTVALRLPVPHGPVLQPSARPAADVEPLHARPRTHQPSVRSEPVQVGDFQREL
jgi:hypothetical protein